MTGRPVLADMDGDGDLDGDGRLDVVVGSYGSGELVVFLARP